MKTLKYYLIAMTLFVFAFAKANTVKSSSEETKIETSVNWTGTYDTNFGQIILLQKGKYVVGTYRELGTIRSLTAIGNYLYIEFDNNGRLGYAKWTKTGNIFSGPWGWNNKIDQGTWKGKKVADAPQNYIKGKWNSTYGELDFISSKTGMMAAHYGIKGGMIWGKINYITKIFEGFYKNKLGAKKETCWFLFKNESFEGKFNDRPRGSWNGERPRQSLNTSSAGAVTNVTSNSTNENYKVKLTLNQYVCHKSDNFIRKKEKAYLGFRNRLTLNGNKQDYHKRENIGRNARWLNDRTWNQWYHKGFMQSYKEGTRHNVNAYFVYNIPQHHLDSGIELVNSFVFKESPTALGRSDFNLNRSVNINEVIRLLNGDTRPQDYPASVNGMFKLPNSPDHYRLETIAGRRYLKCYGDLIDPDNGKIKFGYHYTIELTD